MPSPTRARQRACREAAQQAASAANRDQLLNKVCAKHPNARGRILFLGGIGILVTGSNVVLRGCDVSGFGTGIEVKGPNAVIFDNRACGNGVDVKKSADPFFPARNTCNKAGSGWIEGGQAGCVSRCP